MISGEHIYVVISSDREVESRVLKIITMKPFADRSLILSSFFFKIDHL